MTMEKMRKFWDDRAQFHASGERQKSRFFQLIQESVRPYLEPVLPKPEGSLILEAGCGVGIWVEELAPRGYRMVLSDLSPEMIRHAREKVERMGLDENAVSCHALDICDMNVLPDASFDLVLALGGPLTLCDDDKKAAFELCRVTKPGGYVLCDASNRYRAAFDAVHKKDMSQFPQIMADGVFVSPKSGLKHNLHGPEELKALFQANHMEVLHLAGTCPFFNFPPREELVGLLEDDRNFEMMLDVALNHAENPSILGLSGRLLVVARKCK